jgi:amino acid transporter
MAEKPTRSIGLVGLTFVAVGGVVGSGWLFAPFFAAQLAGPSSVLAWLIGGFMIMLAALTFAEVAAMFPVVGGLGRLPQFTHGNVVGVFIGWTAWIGYVTAAPIEVQALLEYVSSESVFDWLFNGGGSNGKSELSLLGIGVATLLLGVFTIINAFGVQLFTRINTGLTWFKIAVPALVAAALLTQFDNDNFTSHGFAPSGASGVMAAISSGGVVFAFLGFRHALDLAGEAKRPQFTVPASLIISLLICTTLFVLLQIGFIGAMPADATANGWAKLTLPGENGPVAALLAALGMTFFARLVLVDAVVGPFGAGLISSASTARLTMAVSRNGLFPKGLLKLSSRSVPLNALILNSIVGVFILIAFRDGWQAILTFNAGAIVLSMCTGPVMLMALRKELPLRERPFRLPAVRLIANSAFIVVSLIVYWTGWDTMIKLTIPLFFGVVLFVTRVARTREQRSKLDLREAVWLAPYFLGLLALTFMGNFGGGRGWLPPGWDILIVAGFSLLMFPIAVRYRLDRAAVLAYVDEDKSATEDIDDTERGDPPPVVHG